MVTPSRIGLALAGGGPEGAVYEIGALRALDEALDGLRLNDLDIYVGVSAGSFVAACLTNGMSTRQLVRAIVKPDPGSHPFDAKTFFTPALREGLRRASMSPRLIVEALADFVRNPHDQALLESLSRLSRALPVGIFDNEPIRAYIAQIFSLGERTDDFRELSVRLVVVATDLDSGEAVRFGEPGFDHVPISTAVQASSALPGIYPPVEIEGRHYVDGVLLKTLHASVALEAGAELLLCINPIVPIDTGNAVAAGVMKGGRLVNRGLPTVLSQTFRTLVHSRLSVGLASYLPRFPDRDVLLIEPPRDDYAMFFTNILRFSSRKAVCEHAWRNTRLWLAQRREELRPVLARHNVSLRDDVLDDESRDLWREVGLTGIEPAAPISRQLDSALDRLEALLEQS